MVSHKSPLLFFNRGWEKERGLLCAVRYSAFIEITPSSLSPPVRQCCSWEFSSVYAQQKPSLELRVTHRAGSKSSPKAGFTSWQDTQKNKQKR